MGGIFNESKQKLKIPNILKQTMISKVISTKGGITLLKDVNNLLPVRDEDKSELESI